MLVRLTFCYLKNALQEKTTLKRMPLWHIRLKRFRQPTTSGRRRKGTSKPWRLLLCVTCLVQEEALRIFLITTGWHMRSTVLKVRVLWNCITIFALQASFNCLMYESHYILTRLHIQFMKLINCRTPAYFWSRQRNVSNGQSLIPLCII